MSGIVTSPNYPPDQANYSPMTISYFTSGNLANGPTGTRMDLFKIAVDLLIPMRKLDDDIAQLTPYLDTIPAVLQAEVSVQGGGQVGGRFSGTIETYDNLSITYIPNVDYAGIAMRGYRFMMEGVKIIVNT